MLFIVFIFLSLRCPPRSQNGCFCFSLPAHPCPHKPPDGRFITLVHAGQRSRRSLSPPVHSSGSNASGVPQECVLRLHVLLFSLHLLTLYFKKIIVRKFTFTNFGKLQNLGFAIRGEKYIFGRSLCSYNLFQNSPPQKQVESLSSSAFGSAEDCGSQAKDCSKFWLLEGRGRS